jgi:hypothetical protein
LTDRFGQVDAAVRCRIERSQVRVVQPPDTPDTVDPALAGHPETEHTVTVLEILKDNPKLAGVGFTMPVLQPVGTAVVNGVRLVKDGCPFRPFAQGEEYVLLLTWNAARAGFTVSAADTFLMTGAAVTTPGNAPYAAAQKGVLAPEFLARVRAAATAQRGR